MGGSDRGWPVDASVFGRWHAEPDVRPYVLATERSRSATARFGSTSPNRKSSSPASS